MKHLLISLLLLLSLPAAAQIELPRYNPRSRTTIVNAQGRYTYCYRPSARTPQWVAYKLTAADVGGDAGRAGSFYVDTAVIARGYPHATNADYAHSGYDKGHMLPSADRSRTATENRATFIFGNIAPQTPTLNRGTWKMLEEHIRTITHTADTIYIVCGGVNEPQPPTIGSGVAIPQLFFKALAVRRGDDFTFHGYVMPNENPNRDFWQHQVTIDSIERLTGLKLFYCIKNLEQKKN